MKGNATTLPAPNAGTSSAEALPDAARSGSARLLTLAQAAAWLTVSRRTLERLIAAGDFPPPLKIGRSSRFHPEDLTAYLEKIRRERGDRLGES